MQLVAYGAQDIYLTGNPQITFFKVVYRRHTNFSMEAIEQTWNGSSDTNGRCTATISRNGDLVSRMYFEVSGKPNVGISNPGHSFITSVELEIGGQKIDKHTGHWLEVWSELTESNSAAVTGAVAIAATGLRVVDGTLFQTMSCAGGVKGVIDPADPTLAVATNPVDKTFYIPLRFWFNRNPGLALPLIALQYHEVKVILEHKISDCWADTKNKLWCDYIYLDTDERRRFAQVSHEYLIEQVQEQSWTDTSLDLNFNHPVKELIMSQKQNHVSDSAATGARVTADAIGGKVLLKLNGHDRFSEREASYFTRTQIYEHHTGPGGVSAVATAAGTAGATAEIVGTIGVYSFALKPEEHQPSGTCNFSRIDNAQLSGMTGVDTVHAINYNVLRIMSGMGGLAYSN